MRLEGFVIRFPARDCLQFLYCWISQRETSRNALFVVGHIRSFKTAAGGYTMHVKPTMHMASVATELRTNSAMLL